MSEEQTAKKKGLGPLAWIGIGCGVLVLIAFVVMSAGMWFAGKKIKEVAEDFEENPAKAAAEMIVKVNPEIEMVESDEDEGTMTVRFKETGEVATFNYSEIKEGKLSFESEEGKMTFDATDDEEGGVFTMETEEGTARWGAGEGAGEVPDWLPKYPGATVEQVGFTSEMEGTESGSLMFETPDAPDQVVAYFREQFEVAGFTVQENTMSSDGEVQGGLLTASLEADNRQVQVTLAREGEITRASIYFSDAP